MILGLSIPAFTQLHVVISLIGIVSGLIVVYGMLGSQRMVDWTALFLASTVLTSVMGFMFPEASSTPARTVGYISLVLLAGALAALYAFQLRGPWRSIYVVSAVMAKDKEAFRVFVEADPLTGDRRLAITYKVLGDTVTILSLNVLVT